MIPEPDYIVRERGAKPGCDKCGGLGYLVKDVPRESPDFGKAFPCNAPGCLGNKYAQERKSPKALKRKGVDRPALTFESFRKLKGTAQAFDAVKALADGSADFVLLLLCGGTGNGKSHLANAFAVLLNDRMIDCRLFDVAEMMAQLRQGITDGQMESRLEEIRAYEALALDDFKPELATGWQSDVMERLIEYRYKNFLTTLLITNENVEAMPERIVSRFYEPKVGRVVVNTGVDYRRRASQ